ncbi:diguanylate cyclase [Pelomonas sp. P7]|uniref:Diguanylate cyclase n=1 Tax=Pelomonas caseinilytica TaxID=2906763 RepID=A0ABS8XA35_9BURK|nr:diguanylate cyclase [Pelomonas sp. P7]MCE4536152.1 diguanylate cyclase [Pelomonas sp. P7]
MSTTLVNPQDFQQPSRSAPAESLQTVASVEAFEALLFRHLARCRRKGERMTLMWIEFELLTPVDPALGRAPAEDVARALGARLCHRVRRTDLVFEVRSTGFAVLLNAAKDEAGIVERRLQEQLRGPYGMDGWVARVQVSIGLGVASEAQSQGSTLLQCAMDDVYLRRPVPAEA